jgi:hypothetical protein
MARFCGSEVWSSAFLDGGHMPKQSIETARVHRGSRARGLPQQLAMPVIGVSQRRAPRLRSARLCARNWVGNYM